MKKQHLLGIRISVSLILLLIWAIACQEEESLTKSSMNKSQQEELELKTVSIEETKIILEDSRKDLHIKTRSSETENWTNFNMKDITQEPIIGSDQLMTIVSYAVQPDKGYSRALLFKASGLLCKSILSLYPNEESTAKLFSGTIVIRDFEGNFKLGLKVKEGKFIAKFVRNSANIPKTRGILSHRDKLFGDTKLPEVVVIALREYDPFLIDYLLPFELEDYYIFMNAYAFDYYKGQHGNGGGGGSSSPSKEPLPKIDETDIENTKADCVKQALEAGGSNSLLNKLLAGFKLENSPIDITYKVQDKVFGKKGDEVNGLCERVKYSNNSIAITIYLSKTRMQTQSFLETARTILHETLHAHLHGMIDAKDNTTFNTIPDADGLNFKDTWKKYIELHPEEKQHNWMAEKYIGLMKEGLSKLYEQWDDATKIRFEEYAGVTDANRDFMFECIAWHGLLGENHDMTEAGKEFYTKKGEEYEKMKDEVIRYLGKNCPTEK